MLTYDVEADLEDIYDYTSERDCFDNADCVFKKLLTTANNLASLPERGNIHQELQKLGIREYRQIFWKSYRIIYRIIDQHRVIFVIADSKRDM